VVLLLTIIPLFEKKNITGKSFIGDDLCTAVLYGLELYPHQLQELHAATEAMGDRLTRKVFDDFILKAK